MSYNYQQQAEQVWPPWGYHVEQSDLKPEHMERNPSQDSGYASHAYPAIKQEAADGTYFDGRHASYNNYTTVNYGARSQNASSSYGSYNATYYLPAQSTNMEVTSPVSPSAASLASWSPEEHIAYSPDEDGYPTGVMFPPAPAQLPAAHRHSTSSSSSKKTSTKDKPKQYVCLANDCTQKAFARSADLDRHYKQVHRQSTDKDQFACDYKRCPRADGGIAAFGRKDHFRDHLRDFHREDLPKRGGSISSSAVGDDDVGRRNIDARWWRCTKCLQRINVERQGWECPECKMVCERERRLARQGRR